MPIKVTGQAQQQSVASTGRSCCGGMRLRAGNRGGLDRARPIQDGRFAKLTAPFDIAAEVLNDDREEVEETISCSTRRRICITSSRRIRLA